MSTESNATLKIMAFGRPFELGMLYDFRTDKIIPNIPLWKSDITSNSIHCRPLSMKRCTFHVKDAFTDKADLLGMDDNLKLSVFAGLVDSSGAVELIDDRRTTNHTVRFIVKHSITTHLRSLTMAYSSKDYMQHPEMLDQQIATHVVTDILYGVEIFFVFERSVEIDVEDSANIEKHITALLNKIETFHISDSGQLEWNEYEKQLAETLTCRYYGDFQLRSNPTTFEQAVKLYHQLPELIGKNNEYTVPKQVTIYPLYLLDDSRLTQRRFCQINQTILTKSLTFIDHLHRLQVILNDLKLRLTSMKMFDRTKQQLSISIGQFDDYEVNLKTHMMKLLPMVRGGSVNETELTDLDLSSSNQQKLTDWIQFKTEEVKILTDLYNNLRRQHNIHRLACSFAEIQKKSKTEFIFRLIIHVREKNESFLDELFQYLNKNTKRSNQKAIKFDCWFDHNHLALTRKQIASFIKVAKENSKKSNIEFFVNEEYSDDFQMEKGITTILYHHGTRLDFEIPSEPGRPYATDVSYPNVTLRWSKPDCGSQSIQRYKIYGRDVFNRVWQRLLTTENATESIVISDLVKGRYQFKIQGMTLLGDTDESDTSDVIHVEATRAVARVPRLSMRLPSPVVTPGQITREKAVVDVTPAWFEPVKSVSLDKIRLPTNYNKNSPIDVRTYTCLSTFRSMTKKSAENIDFVAEPFTPAVDNLETLVVVLNELATQLGARLTFTNQDFKYNDSDYRTACGVTNLGSIHSFLASDGQYQTAKFDLHLTLDYDQITASPETLQKFILTSIKDIASIAQCNKDFIRVFDIRRASSIIVGFGITTPDTNETKQVADSVTYKLNEPSITKRPDIFQYLIPGTPDYKVEPALAYVQLQISDFEHLYNRNYQDAQTEERGGYPYYFPQGWYRHALKVTDKYPDDHLWLGMCNAPGEWAVAYHGTGYRAVRGIVDNGLLHSFVTTDVCKPQAEQQNPLIPDVKGLYVATHCENGASQYTESFDLTGSQDSNKYQVVFQCRVEPGKFTEHKSPVKEGMAWRVFDEKAIRPYGLLLKSL